MRGRRLALALGALAVLLARRGTAQAPAGDLRGLPLVEVPARHAAPGAVVVLLTGDGGWADVDKSLGAGLAERGFGVVGLDSRAYLSHPRTPDETAADVARVARAYLGRWGARDLVLLGYSRGADMLPFVASRLPADLRARTRLVAMLGLASAASFTFHWSDLVRDTSRPTDLPILPELAKLRGTRMLCVYGTEERDSGCRAADSTLVTKYARPGAHHFDRDYRALARLVADAVP